MGGQAPAFFASARARLGSYSGLQAFSLDGINGFCSTSVLPAGCASCNSAISRSFNFFEIAISAMATTPRLRPKANKRKFPFGSIM